ncbi:hypothetical protein [Fulvivirga lutimaris]|uniref:hypothetical protein n=1 Tax=Fulvivirga lutimaris TaxID=1819566 RepID=UPI0012BBDF6A|nr:hypothetical protein [Fulvivirga lutimaris]MTI41700.1 hypothetical protein [Fulvivirga lutimaris]
MENMNISDEELLDFIDGNSSSSEKKKIENILENDADLNERVKMFSKSEGLLKNEIKSSPSRNFTAMVMDRVTALKNPYHKGGIAIWILTLISVMACSYFLTDITLNINLDFIDQYIPELPIIDTPTDIKVDQPFNMLLISKVLLYGMLFIALMLLDKTVLRPYFKNRQMTHH